MGKTTSRLSQAFGFGGNSDPNELAEPPVPRPAQWDTQIDQLFGDAPPDDDIFSAPPLSDVPDIPERPKRRRRSPPPIPGSNRAGRRPAPPSPSGRRRRHRGGGRAHAMRTPIVPDLPRRPARSVAHAVNAPFGANRRPMALPSSISEQEIASRIALSNNFKRRPSNRRKRPLSQRTQRLQELLQCPVCLTSYIEPRLLPCGHTYCDECLNRLMQNDNDVVTCPECRKQHLVPDDGVFPPNFVVRNLLDDQGVSTASRLMTLGNLSLNGGTTAKCTACETFAPLRLCRHCNYMVCDRCLRAHRHGLNDPNGFIPQSKLSTGKMIQFYVAVRKITRSQSQVKRLTIDMPIGNFLRDNCQTLIQRISEREQLQSPTSQFVLEFGDKRLGPRRTLASYGVQNGDLLFLFNPDQHLNFLAYEDEENTVAPPLPIPNPSNRRVRSSSLNSSASDIRTTTSNDVIYNRTHHPLSPIFDQDDMNSSIYDED